MGTKLGGGGVRLAGAARARGRRTASRHHRQASRMKRALEPLIAAGGVFAGSVIADIAFGDGIQTDDVEQAVLVACIAAVIQIFLARSRRG